jgi:glucose dehydrogenase
MMQIRIVVYYTLLAALVAPNLPAQKPAAGDWPMYAHDPSSTRFSPLKEINASNVAKLTEVWRFDNRPSANAKAARSSQTTPLVVDGVMYLLTPFQSLVALDPETGKQIWVYQHQHEGRSPRGIAYWPGDKNSPPTIFFGNEDGFLVAVNAKTGKAVPGFANEGDLDLKPGMKDGYPYSHYGVSSAPFVYKNLVITGSHVQDSPALGGKGDVRAWDASTGKLVWTFHTIPRPGETGHETWLKEDSWKDRSGANVWTSFSLDPETGTLFLPIGSATYDLYGGDRPGDDLFANSLVALDAMTGKLKWYFQAVHHDLWDYDLPPQPTMVDIVKDGKKIPALVEAGKTGLVYILDRRTGKPVFGVEERPVPKGDVPGEWYSPTQPFPLKPPPLARMSFKREDLASITPEHRKACEALLDADGGAHNDGPFTPTGLKNTIIFPGSLGGANWGGGSYDPTLGYYFINVRNTGQIGKMVSQVPAPKPLPRIIMQGDTTQNPWVRRGPRGPMSGFSDLATGWPCQAPPWGELFAINVNTGDIAWHIPFGRIEELEAKGIMNTGAPNLGGSVATAGGLLFIGATEDQRFHAYDSKTGKLLWETKLPAPAIANPISYRGKNGKQYIAIQADNYLVAFGLP